jgi:hypothetical protein
LAITFREVETRTIMSSDFSTGSLEIHYKRAKDEAERSDMKY